MPTETKTITVTLTGPADVLPEMIREYAEAGGMTADGKDPQTGQPTTPEEFGKKLLGQHFLQMVMSRRGQKAQLKTQEDGAKMVLGVSVA
jgi:hypothetical protein